MIRDFARHIITIDASCGGEKLRLSKIDKQTWQAEPCDDDLMLTYTVYAWDLSVRGAHLDNSHAYFNGPCVFLSVDGREHETCECEITLPDSPHTSNWLVATGMPAFAVQPNGAGTYRLPDYEALLDHPVEMGEFNQTTFEVDGISHRFIVSGRQRGDLSRLCNDLEKICAEHITMFGELPVENYLFLLWVVGDGYGGLEHRNSTSLLCSRDDLPVPGLPAMSDGYRKLLGLCSHEYFHLWNVKRIMPKVFQTSGTDKEVYTRQLWVFEGITSYYDDLALVRSTSNCWRRRLPG